MNDGIEFCPPHLDEIGIQAWKNITPKLWAKGLMLPLDSDMLALLCCAFSDYIRCLDEAKSEDEGAPDKAKILYEIAEDYRRSCRRPDT